MELSQTLANLRKTKGLTQIQLGKELGVTNKTISKWENGVFLPDITYLVDIANFYGITVDQLLKGTIYDPNKGRTVTPFEKSYKRWKKVFSFGLGFLFFVDILLLIVDWFLLNDNLRVLIWNVVLIFVANSFVGSLLFIRYMKYIRKK